MASSACGGRWGDAGTWRFMSVSPPGGRFRSHMRRMRRNRWMSSLPASRIRNAAAARAAHVMRFIVGPLSSVPRGLVRAAPERVPRRAEHACLPTVSFPARPGQGRRSVMGGTSIPGDRRSPMFRQRTVPAVTEVLLGSGRSALLAWAPHGEAAYDGINNRAVGPVPKGGTQKCAARLSIHWSARVGSS
jgi:hypothetical protein